LDRTFPVLFENAAAYASGAGVMLLVTVLAAVVGLLLGVVIFVMRISLEGRASNAFSGIMAAASPLVQAVPVMVLLVWVHYSLPEILGVRFSALTTSIIVLSVVSMLTSASILVSAYLKIPRDEIEAAQVLGIAPQETWRRVIFPMVWRDSLPLFLGHWIDLAKLSTLCSAIALPELLNTTSSIVSNTYQALPAYTALGIIFIALLLPLNILQQRLETTLPVKR
jgi:polar amino acid transport system permease protein